MAVRQALNASARVGAVVAFVSLSASALSQASGDLEQLSLDDLMRVPISLQRRDLELGDVPAAVYVITPEEIRRMGFNSIPEALRMVPGLNVARIDRSSWAISARGFNGRFANKLLVLVDGQIVYTPNFSGVFWDAIDIPIDAIERIEVIRGPGGTLYGPNAVNGIINIITKKAGSDRGIAVDSRYGDYDTVNLALVYDTVVSPSLSLHVDGMSQREGSFRLEDGSPGNDGWNRRRAGARIDWTGPGGTEFTLIGRGYEAHLNRIMFAPSFTPPFLQRRADNVDQEAWSVLGRVNKQFGRSSASLQIAYDLSDRTVVDAREERETFDVDLAYDAEISPRFEWQAGLSYRTTADDIENSFATQFAPTSKTLSRWSGHLQGVWKLDDRNQLIAGVKAMDDTLSGFEIQPSIRWIATTNESEHVWAAVTRAVRTPARADRSVQVIVNAQPGPGGLPVFGALRGSPNFDEETVLSIETGYRRMWGDHTYFDVAAFVNFYDNLRTFEPGPIEFHPAPSPHFILPVNMANKAKATTAGCELLLKKKVNERWDVEVSYSLLDLRLRLDPDSNDVFASDEHFSVPRHQALFQTSLLLGSGWSAHGFVQYVDALGDGEVPAYWRVDARIAYATSSGMLFEAGVNNLFRPASTEFHTQVLSIPSQIPMTVYVGARGRF